ncbi:3-demethylubiquinone-9 3-methyltransferase [Escherichia coli]|uniref:3-demethylubiquinone-9 3-methyltransferase n=1 Tax=Escherichia coli TaxID=562 RepID=A0A376KQP5_ECOLX|nr:3-demethylubiquinone-9 3-methyltransferase [Escherichia coli]
MNAEKSPENHNVDHEEIAKFEAVASRWWDLEGEFKPLHALTRCVWAILPSVLAVYLAKRCSMSVVAAAFWREYGARRRDGDRSGYGL